uniref:Solute carrier family 15 member 5 n=1 Tax=Cyprinus carpio TaxID=7962 RepID=A0A8C2JG09_CYPCA
MPPIDAFDTHDGHLPHGICTSSYPGGMVTKPRKARKKLQVIVCVLFVELFERFTFFGIVCNMILFCTIKLGYSSYQAAMVNTCFVGASVLTPVLVGWFAETCLGRTTVLCFCALLHFFGTALLPVVAFPFEDFYINTHNIVHQLEPHEQHILFYTGLVAVALGIGGIRAILCPMAAYHLQDTKRPLLYNQNKDFSLHANTAFCFTGRKCSCLVLILTPNCVDVKSKRLQFTLQKCYFSLLTTLGVFLNSLKMCCLHYRHLSGDVANWLDRAKENNGGCYSETSVENVKILVKLFPLFGLQLLYRACITQIPSGYYLQTMHSNLKLNGFLLPVAVMKVISILPVLILAPLLELLNTCSRKSPTVPLSACSMGHACAALSALLAGISEIHRKYYPQVEQTLSGKVLHVSSMTCFQLTPQYILLGVAEAFVTPACTNLRGVSLHFLTLSYGGGCFLGAFLIHILYFVSGGNFYPNNLSSGNMERFFFTLATLMAINTLVFWRISQRYGSSFEYEIKMKRHSHLYEKLLQYKTCLRFYDTLDRSDTLTSMETVL